MKASAMNLIPIVLVTLFPTMALGVRMEVYISGRLSCTLPSKPTPTGYEVKLFEAGTNRLMAVTRTDSAGEFSLSASRTCSSWGCEIGYERIHLTTAITVE